MAKKSKARKSKKKRKTTRRPQAKRPVTGPMAQEEAVTPRVAAARRKAAPARTVQPKVNFAEEYAYVYTDLKRVAIIAAAMLVILVVLAFVIT